MEYFGQVGETLTGFSPNVPNSEFFPHAMLVLSFIAINLGVPVSVLLLDPTKSNFSAWRGAIDQARLGFRVAQGWLSSHFHSPVYRWKVRQWLAEDAELARFAARDDVDIFAHTWHPPTWQYIDPLKDASADLLAVRNGLNSPRRIQATRGRDWSTVCNEIVEDNGAAITKAIQAAADITAATGVAVHWREVLSLPTPDGVQVGIAASTDETEGAPNAT